MNDIEGASLRRVLLRRLLWPLIPLLLLGIVLAYVLAYRAAVNAYDAGLVDDARDLSDQIVFKDRQYRMELPQAAAQMLAKNNEDRVVYAIWNGNGEPIAGDIPIVQSLKMPREYGNAFQDIAIGDTIYRATILRRAFDHGDIFIAVAETTKGRTKLLEQIFSSMLFLGAVLVTISIAVVVTGVHAGLVPVEKLRNEIASRSPNDLKPLPETYAPLELRPIVHGINELLEKLSASFASYRRFIADAAHQLRTPLAGLGTQIELNLAHPPENIDRLLRELLATTRRTSHLANQLLSLARLEHTDDTALGDKLVNLRDWVQETAADFVVRAAKRQIEFDFDVEPIQIKGSALLLRELLGNLFDNAIRYAPLQSGIYVSVRADDKQAVLIVRNAAPEIPRTELAKLGTPFYRPANSAAEGCGLGLAIVREIAHIHRGKIKFESADQHFTASIYFPIASA